MHPFLVALIYASLPAAGNFAGGLLAEFIRVSKKTLSLALHAAAGLIVGVVGIELVPRTLETDQAWISLLALMGGAAFFMGVDQVLEVVKKRMGGAVGSGPLAIYFGVSVDLFTDGLLIGTGSSISPSLGLLLALGQLSADVPEGFATIATLKGAGLGRSKRLLLTASFAFPLFIGTSVGFWVVRDQPAIVKLSLLAFTAGILLAVMAEEIIPEAHKDGEARVASLFFVGGFTLFAALSVYLG